MPTMKPPNEQQPAAKPSPRISGGSVGLSAGLRTRVPGNLSAHLNPNISTASSSVPAPSGPAPLVPVPSLKPTSSGLFPKLKLIGPSAVKAAAGQALSIPASDPRPTHAGTPNATTPAVRLVTSTGSGLAKTTTLGLKSSAIGLVPVVKKSPEIVRRVNVVEEVRVMDLKSHQQDLNQDVLNHVPAKMVTTPPRHQERLMECENLEISSRPKIPVPSLHKPAFTKSAIQQAEYSATPPFDRQELLSLIQKFPIKTLHADLLVVSSSRPQPFKGINGMFITAIIDLFPGSFDQTSRVYLSSE